MRIVLVEDEAVVARRLERMVRDIAGDDVDSLDVADSLSAAQTLVHDRPPDLVFLDLNLGGRNGFRLLEEAMAESFQTIVVSAHHDQALRAFEYGVVDFVAKPFTEERLRKALERATSPASRGRARCLAVRKGRELRTIPLEKIAFIRGADDYSELHLDDGTVHLHQKTLTALERVLPEEFVRIHRSYIAPLHKARGLRANALVLADGRVVPVGRSYREGVRGRMLGA